VKKWFVILAAMLLLLSAMISCGSGGGGGGDNSSSSNSAEGLYKGTTNTGRNIYGLILSDGTYYFIYSGLNYSGETGGVLQGGSSSFGENLTSDDAMDLNIEGAGIVKGKVTITYTPKESAYGMMRLYDNDVYTFTTTYDSDYENKPSLSAIAGTFSGWVAFSQGKENATWTVSSTGAITANGESGCTATGSAKTHSRGNVYDVSISFGGVPCHFANQTMTGIGYYDPEYNRMWITAPNGDRTDGILFEGDKQ
jgi:hypothetical protein